MKVACIIGILMGMLIAQGKWIPMQWRVLAGAVGLGCFIALIVWALWSKRSGASDPVLMLHDGEEP